MEARALLDESDDEFNYSDNDSEIEFFGSFQCLFKVFAYIHFKLKVKKPNEVD